MTQSMVLFSTGQIIKAFMRLNPNVPAIPPARRLACAALARQVGPLAQGAPRRCQLRSLPRAVPPALLRRAP